jgi:hypothetical protein
VFSPATTQEMRCSLRRYEQCIAAAGSQLNICDFKEANTTVG